jgi:hypothetical protein
MMRTKYLAALLAFGLLALLALSSCLPKPTSESGGGVVSSCMQ